MKIPTTAPGAAPFYHGGPPINGMEMNPQAWQGNGVIPEGGAPGNGAMYMMTQPAHMPTAFVGGPPAGYYATGMPPAGPHQLPHQQTGNVPLPHPIPVPAQDFSEYMWMENEEEFDKQVMQQLEEEALMEQCIEAMLADEREAHQRGPAEGMDEQISKSTLNPLAAEFVPTFGPPSAATSASMLTNPEIDCPSPDDSTPSPLSSESEVQKSSSPVHTTPQRNTADAVATNDKHTEEIKVPSSSEDVKEEPVKKAEVIVEIVKATEVSAKPLRTEGNRPPAKPSSNNTAANKRGKAEPSKKTTEAVVKPAENTDGIKSSKAKENAKSNKANKESATRSTASSTAAKKTEAKKETVKTSAKVVSELADDFRNALNTTVDLQGPPLPVSSAAVSSTPPGETDKSVASIPAAPTIPAVFNYAAAARANLPPKQSAAPAPAAAPSSAPPSNKPEPTVTSNNSSVSRETTPTAKNTPAAKTNAANQQRGTSKESNASSNSSSKGSAAPSSSFAKMASSGNNRKAKK